MRDNRSHTSEWLNKILRAIRMAYRVWHWIVLSGVLITGTVYYIKINSDAKPVPAPMPQKLDYGPSEIQKQQIDFGPFISQADAGALRKKAGVNNFALLKDTGEVRYSLEWTISAKDLAWKPSASPYITSFEVKGTAVKFVDDRGNSFCLNLDQPFQFENKATIVFIFDFEGKLKQALRDEVRKVSLERFKTFTMPNSELSIL